MAVKRIIVGAHYGLRDWLWQRITAIIMAIYTIIFLVVFVVHNPQDFEGWRSMFAMPLFKSMTIITLLSLCYHAWVGIRDIWMDYVKPVGIRLSLHVITALALIIYAIWAVLILWGVK